MMYCPRCNNTYWIRIDPRGIKDRIAVLRLKRPYRCVKCERVRLGSIFLKFVEPELKCPKCGSDVRRAHRSPWERMILIVRPYRCLKCQARFRKFRFV